MESNNGYASAKEIRDAARKDVELPSGIKVQIRRIGVSTFAQIYRAIPDVSSLASGDESARAERAEKILSGPGSDSLLKLVDEVLVEGVAIPKLGMDPQTETTPADFSFEDRLVLFGEISRFSGRSKEAAQRVVPFSAPSA